MIVQSRNVTERGFHADGRNMRVLICGGRDYADASTLWGALDAIHRQCAHDSMIVIQGGARGADQIAREWCAARKVQCVNYVADWEADGRAVGPIRNQRMIDDGRPDRVLAFPGGKGTADMVRRARAANLDVVEVTC